MKFVYMSIVLILGSFNMMQSGTKTFECADGYKFTVPGSGLLSTHTAACAGSPFKKCCECVLGQAICSNKEHGGLKPGSFPKHCNKVCPVGKRGMMRAILLHLGEQEKNIPVKDFEGGFWIKVVEAAHAILKSLGAGN